MTRFLTSSYDVHKFHPMTDEFTKIKDLSELTERPKKDLETKDNELFTKEGKRGGVQDNYHGERMADHRDSQTTKELNNSVHDWMVVQ